MKEQKLKMLEISKAKAFVLTTINDIVKKCDEDIKSYMVKLNDDFLHYFTVNAKSHVICTMMKQQFEELSRWVEAEEEEQKVVELLDSGVEFMTKKLLNYRRTQSTNELYNLMEEYKLEMYSNIIPTYQQISNTTKKYLKSTI